MTPIRILFSRFSAFYAPLIAAFAGPFLAEEGLAPSHGTLPAGASAEELVASGAADVAQSAVSQGFLALERGRAPAVRHFAQINAADGFFLAGRAPEPDFSWPALAGRRVLIDHGGQPLAMFRYACARAGANFDAIESIDAGGPAEMEAAFRAGEGDYVHLQGPAPQRLAAEGKAHIAAAVGRASGPCAFSSLMAAPAWLAGAEGAAFARGYRKARAFVVDAPAAEVAAAVAPFFPETAGAAVERTVADYRALGCWAPGIEITPEAFRAAEDAFRHAGLVSRRHDYAAVCAPPPG